MSEWYSVADRLPGIGDTVLTFNENNGWYKVDEFDEITEAPVSFSAQTITTGAWFLDDDEYEVTHWMDIPEPPN